MNLPVVLATSVVRGAEPGAAHGGLYRIELESGRHTLVREWDDPTISWGGRGGERGLRGIAVTDAGIWAASSSSLVLLDPSTYEIVKVYDDLHLGNNHEIWAHGPFIHVTSTERDRLVRFDTRSRQFDESVRLQISEANRIPGVRRLLYRTVGNQRVSVRSATSDTSCEADVSDTCHLNSIRVFGDAIEVSGTSLRHLVRIEKRRARAVARLPRGTHNAVRDRGELIYNDTRRGCLVAKHRGRKLEMRPRTASASALRPDRSTEPAVATPNFCRGLVTLPHVLIGGSSPATVTAYDRRTGAILQSVQLVDDVTNAVHGLVMLADVS